MGAATETGARVVWLAELGANKFHLCPDIRRPRARQAEKDYSHAGVALESRGDVNAVAARAKAAGCLIWEPASLIRSDTTAECAIRTAMQWSSATASRWDPAPKTFRASQRVRRRRNLAKVD